jgi:hypothetical protein
VFCALRVMGVQAVVTVVAMPRSQLGDANEEYRLLGCSTVWVWFEPTFRRNVSPPSLGQVNNTRLQVSR